MLCELTDPRQEAPQDSETATYWAAGRDTLESLATVLDCYVRHGTQARFVTREVGAACLNYGIAHVEQDPYL
jgi:hypothetical protein